MNNPRGGAAFSTEGGTATDENGVIARNASIDDFVGTGLPTGSNLQSGFRPQTPLYRITVHLANRPTLPIDRAGPSATLVAADVVTTGAALHTIQVTYADPSGVNVSRIGTDDLQIVGRNGRRLNVVGVTTDALPGVFSRTVVAIYTIGTRIDPSILMTMIVTPLNYALEL